MDLIWWWCLPLLIQTSVSVSEAQALNPKFGSETSLVIYLKPLHGWRECHTVLRLLEWRDLHVASPLSLWEVISQDSRARLQEWERVSLWSLTVSLPTRWVTGNAWVLIFSPVAAIGLKPLASKRLKRGDKHVNLPRPSPSAAASVPLCISRCSFSWTIRQDDILSITWWDVIQTFSLLSAGAGRNALCTHGFACAGRAACCVCWRQAGQAITFHTATFAIMAFQGTSTLFSGPITAPPFPPFPQEDSWNKLTGLFCISFL